LIIFLLKVNPEVFRSEHLSGADDSIVSNRFALNTDFELPGNKNDSKTELDLIKRVLNQDLVSLETETHKEELGKGCDLLEMDK
ncbi:hypothetical protein STEG23_005267, partial [Scotinomys teguina]